MILIRKLHSTPNVIIAKLYRFITVRLYAILYYNILYFIFTIFLLRK